MSKTKSYKKKKHLNNQLVVMSRIDFEIAKRVYERILELGMDDEEVSFLMGKRNKYVFDILDPTEKDKFKTEQLDYLPTILRTSIRELVPNEQGLNEEIKIRASKAVYDHKVVYQYSEILENGTEGEPVTWTKKLKVGTKRKVNEALLRFIQERYDKGYFDRHRSALELYQKAEKHFTEGAFSSSDLQKCLSVLMTAKGSHQLLKRVNLKARYYYVKK